MLIAFVPLLASIGESVAMQYIKSDTARELVNFAFDIVEQGVDAESKLTNLLYYVRNKKDEAAQRGETWTPTEEEMDVVWRRINARDERWEGVDV